MIVNIATAKMARKNKHLSVDLESSITRIQQINESSDGYLEDLVPDEAFQWEAKFDANKRVLPSHATRVLARDLTKRDLRACLDLIASTSSADYRASSMGWSRAKKSKEMQLPDLRYVLLRSSRDGGLQGFMSFMLTFEDGFEVIYLYELHLRSEMQGLGIGNNLMAILEKAGRTAEIKKAMLTVFKANEKALRFYKKLGYEEDDFSPRPRKLRNGIVKEQDYIILSKEISKDYDDAEVRRLNRLAERSHPLGSSMPPSRKRKAQ